MRLAEERRRRKDDRPLETATRVSPTRTVTDMENVNVVVKPLDQRIVESLTVENWVRYRGFVEAGAAILYFLVASLGEVSRGGSSAFLFAFVLAAAVGLHRLQPLISLLLTAFAAVMLPLFGFAAGSTVSIFLFPVVVTLFATSLYGKALTKWLGLVAVVFGALGLAALSWWFGSEGGVFYFVFGLAVAGLPWTAGVLVRSLLDRRELAEQGRALGASVAETEVRLTAVEQQAALEHERNRVARDVHDIVAHSLAVVIAQADGARYAAKASPESVDEALSTIAATARGALGDVRALLTELRHSQEAGPQPGMNELDALVRGFRESGLDITWTSYGTGVPLSESAGLAVYRVVQESLTNALRHGGRTRPVDLEFDWSDATLTVSVTNDLPAGERSANPAGHGIPGMRERATLAGGSFAAGDGTNGRYRVRIVLPLDRGGALTQPMAISEVRA
jgi:signal transduction histidine kinase